MHTASRSSRPQPTSADLGLHTLARGLLCVNGLLLVVTLLAFRWTGLSISMGAGAWALHLLPTGLLFAFWMIHRLQPGRPNEWWIAEAALALGIVGMTTSILAPAQYPAAAFARPMITPLLAQGDALFGVHVPSLAAWVRETPIVAATMWFVYGSFLLQMLLVIPVLWYTRDRRGLWEYVTAYQFCAIVTVLFSGLFPSLVPSMFYGFTATIDESGFYRHFPALRDGTMTVVSMTDLQGLISMPSFHVIGALLVTTAVRRRRWLFGGAVILNGLMIASTFVTGIHFFVDVLGGAVVWVAGLCIYRLVADLVPRQTVALCEPIAANASRERILPRLSMPAPGAASPD
jgi:hypothetical protein